MIVTFYSYKGGVGRTFCLANVAVRLTSWGYRVLCVDWDLHSPGLHSYFGPWLPESPTRGLVEAISVDGKGPIEWQKCVLHANITGVGDLGLLPAGGTGQDHVTRLQAISWPHLIEHGDLGWRLEDLRDEMALDYDFVLVDSRAGTTDIGDICTARLPDVLVLCLNPNRQNVDGALDVLQRATAIRDESPYDKGRLLVAPVVTRFDLRDHASAEEWRQRVADTYTDHYRAWIPKNVTPLNVLDSTIVPHLPEWSFGEQIVEHRCFTNIAALLAHELAEANVLVADRDGYVEAAREKAARPRRRRLSHNVFVLGTSPAADVLRHRLAMFGLHVAHPESLSSARHFVVVLDEGTTHEAVQALTDKVRATTETSRLLFVITHDESELSEPLDTWHVFREGEKNADGEVARVIAAAVAGAIDDGDDDRGQAVQVLARIGEELLRSGRVADARDFADRAGKLAKRWTVELAGLTGQLAYYTDDLANASRLLQEVVVRAPESPEATRAHLTLGRIAVRRNEFEDANAHFDQALAGHEDRELRLVILRVKADAAEIDGRYEDAIDCLTKAADLAAGTDGAPALALALGELHADRGNLADAEPWLRDAVRSAGLNVEDHVMALRRLGHVLEQRGNVDEALKHLDAALTHAIAAGNADRVVDAAADHLGILNRVGRTGDVEFALDKAHTAVDGVTKARLLCLEGDLRVNGRDFERANYAFTHARTLYRRHEDRVGEVRAVLGLARAEKAAGLAGEMVAVARRLLAGLRGPEADSLRWQVDDLKGR